MLSTVGLTNAVAEIQGLGLYPLNKRLDFRHFQQGFDRVVLLGQFCFRQQRVDLAVADPVQSGRLFATLHFRHQVMLIALRGGNLSTTKGAYRGDKRPVPALDLTDFLGQFSFLNFPLKFLEVQDGLLIHLLHVLFPLPPAMPEGKVRDGPAGGF